MLISIDLLLKLFSEFEFAGRMGAFVRVNSNELIVMRVLNVLHKISVKHEGSFEDTNDDEIDGALLLTELIVVLIYFVSHLSNYLLNVFIWIKNFEFESISRQC